MATVTIEPVAWRYAINYGPNGEENWANVYDAQGEFVGNLRTHHARAVVAAKNRDARLSDLEVRIAKIGRLARSDGNRTFDDCIRDLGWIDDECRGLIEAFEP